MTISQNRWAELITVEAATQTVGAQTYPYLKLQREIFNRAAYAKLCINQMAWARGLNISNYSPFIYENGTLDSAPYNLDVLRCYLNGPVVVVINKNVHAYMKEILNAIQRTQILRNRTPVLKQ